MRRMVEEEVRFCDFCGQRANYDITCVKCGVEHCYECSKTRGKQYAHSLYATGSGDGYYCFDCDRKLTKEGGDELHAAYRRIESLQKEAKAWNEDFSERAKHAEKSLKKIQGRS